MKRKTMKFVLVMLLMVVTLITACTPKEPKETVKEEPVVEQIENRLYVNITAAENSFTAIQHEPINLQEFVSEVTFDEGLDFEAVTITYDGSTVTIDKDVAVDAISEVAVVDSIDEDIDDSVEDDIETDVEDTAEEIIEDTNASFTLLAVEGATDLLNEDGVLNAFITFTNVTNEATDLEITFTGVCYKGNQPEDTVTVKVNVVPAMIGEIRAITDNLRISDELENYDLGVRAENIQKQTDKESNIKAITVKESNVEFRQTGSYDVVYDVELKTPIVMDTAVIEEVINETDNDVVEDNSDNEITVIEVPTEVEIVTPDEVTDDKKPIITEDVKPDEVIEPTPKPVEDARPVAPTAPAENNTNTSGSNANNGNTGNSGNASNSGNNAGNSNTGNNNPNAGKTWVPGQYETRQVQKTRTVDNWVDEGYNENVTQLVSVWVASDGARFYDMDSITIYMKNKWLNEDIYLTSHVEQETRVTGTRWVSKMVNRPKQETYTENVKVWVDGYWK